MPGGRFLTKLAKPFLNRQVARYRKAEGSEPAQFMGFPILLLTTVFHNIAKNPDKVWIQVGNRKMHASVESLQGTEREAAYGRVVAVAKNYGSYLTKTDREIPVLRVTPAPE